MGSDSFDLTICTVSFNHAPHLRLNFDQTAGLNPNAKIRWIVAENSPSDSAYRLTAADLPKGALFLDTADTVLEKNKVNLHHVTALNACIEQVTTRYMLILDPDFYATRPNWVDDIISHAQQKKLALFGAPWNPRHLRHYRNFPCVHFTLVDRDAFSADRPYTPNIIFNRRKHSSLKAGYRAPGVPTSTLERWWRSNVMRRLFSHRWGLSGAIFDTGSELYGRYWMGERIAFECLLPIFNPTDFREPELIRGPLNRVIEALVPEYLSYLPRQKDTYTRMGSFIPATPLTEWWEEFLWKGEPFGFHMRGYPSRESRDVTAEVEELRKTLEGLI